MLCPNKHANPDLLTFCQTCGLPLVDLRKELALVTSRLRSKSVLAKPKNMAVLVGVGTLGVTITRMSRSSEAGRSPRIAYLAVDSTGRDSPAKDDNSMYFVKIGQDDAGSTFSGRAEIAANDNHDLLTLLRRCGIRDRDENQSTLLTVGLGGGTGSGAGPVVLERARQLNPVCFNYVLAVLPSVAESLHAHANSFYGLSRLLRWGERGALADALVVIQYDRLKHLRGVGAAGEELKMEGLLAALFSLMQGTLTGPSVPRVGTLIRWMRAPVLVPCLALGRSMEIFGSLSNVLESSVAYPLGPLSERNVSSSYLLLKVPHRLATLFPDSSVADEFGMFSHRHFPNVVSLGQQICQTDEQHDRVDACVLLSGDNSTISETATAFERLKLGVKTAGYWETYGLNETKIADAERILALYPPSPPN